MAAIQAPTACKGGLPYVGSWYVGSWHAAAAAAADDDDDDDADGMLMAC